MRRLLLLLGLCVGLALVTLTAQAQGVSPATAHATRTGPGGSAAMAALPTAAPDLLALGERLYLEGRGEGGRAIVGLRFGGIEAQGAAVACANCHRRSGLGAVEGVDQVPPIAGRFIFTDDPRAVVSMNFRNIKSFNQRHDAFTDAGFEAAVRLGRHLSGRELSPMMPRFELADTELRALQAYLHTLSREWSPGVTATSLRLATVITPDVSPQRREIFLQTLQAAVRQKNGNYTPGQRTMSSAAEMLFRSDRFWEHEVWELHGEPSTWAAQLDERQRARPVFALVSGLGAGEWGPVHAFCERQRTPCWFPSVDAPPAEAARDFYSLYLSAGVTLEADVLGRHFRAERPQRVVQVHRGDDAGRAGAERLRTQLAGSAIPVDTVAVGAAGLQAALADVSPRDAVVLWWPEAEVAGLVSVALPSAPTFVSARLLGAHPEALPGPWKTAVRVVYPYQVADQRHASLFNFEWWLRSQRIPLRDLTLQSEAYFAMTYLAETLTDMVDNVHRDYLIERAENMLSLREGQRGEDEAREATIARHNKAPGGAQGAMARLAAAGPSASLKSPRPMPGLPQQTAVKREGTTVYPRLSLAQGQRFASKGAYLARFADSAAVDVTAISGWIVP